MIKLYLFIVAGILLMQNIEANEYQKPEFTLQVVITGVGADIRLNDISIEFEKNIGHSVTTYDVNDSVISGTNELKAIIFPFKEKETPHEQTTKFHPEAEVIMSLYVNEKGDVKNKKILSQIHLLPTLPLDEISNKSKQILGIGDVIIDNSTQPLVFSGIKINQQITATRKSLPVQSNHPRWAWLDGMTLENNQDTYNSLLATYREIYQTHKSKDKNKLFFLEKEAAKEFSLAYYLEGGTDEGHALIETAEIFNNPEAELYDFFTDGLKLEIFADGKLARIVDIAQYHPIIYTHKTLDIVFALKFAFYKNKENKWIMIR